jgi:hypothetical protein
VQMEQTFRRGKTRKGYPADLSFGCGIHDGLQGTSVRKASERPDRGPWHNKKHIVH